MNAKNAPWVGIGICLSLVILSISAAIKVIPNFGKVADGVADMVRIPSKIVDGASAAFAEWGQNKIKVNIQVDHLGIKPIAELALAKVRVRSILKYSTTVMNSTKQMIGHQAFDVRLGWNLKDDISCELSEKDKKINIVATMPHILTITHVEDAPEMMSVEDGLINKLTPGDMRAFQIQLEAAAKRDSEVTEAIEIAKEEFEKYFRGVFGSQGFAVSVTYRDDEAKSDTEDVFIPKP